MSDIREFVLPDLGEGLEDGEIVTWHVEVGDDVQLNQPVVDVETAKAVVAVPSPFAGRIVERFGDEGETLQVGAVLLRIDLSAPDTAGASTGLDAEDEPQPLVGYGQGRAGSSRSPRRRGRLVSVGTGADSRGSESRGAGDAPGRVTPLAKPPVRKLARDLGVDLAGLAPGSGPDGTITREDVQHAAAVQRGVALGEAQATRAPAEPRATPGFRGRTPGDVERISGVRRRIVEKMERSRREIPEATCSRDADLTDLWAARGPLTAQARAEGHDVRITPYVLVLRATVEALRRYPGLNARIDRDADEIRLLETLNLGVAVDTERGLLVPNIKHAESLTTLLLALELSRLTTAARDGSITPDEVTGGTFTANNYGAFGNDDGNPIINHPEAAILGLGAIRERPWVVEGGLAVRRVATFTLAFDHRVCDGGEAGRFVTEVATLCEQPARLLLHA